MYDPDDVARSVRRYVLGLLGEPWAFSLERKEVPDEARPAGLVELGAAAIRRARISVPQGNIERFIPVTVTLYPSLATPREAGRTARYLANGLDLLMAVGASGVTFQNGRPAAGPERIPLYDYADVPLAGTDAERAGPAFPHDVLWVEDYSARALEDPLDPQRWSVILEMRVSWEQPGRVGPPAPIAARMPGGYQVA